MDADKSPIRSFVSRQRFLEISLGKKENACRCTESPEKPSENAIKDREIAGGNKCDFIIKFVEYLAH